ncbi:lipoprotein [Spiroplasma tabanidicola]|uniref:Lipoprotein n=1 Tax=Spiroplasma tabanidicola TaxID=324079 RepID=A0A6I6CDZ3_9MOLU|nr:lipoprotein [Spiroplasma tabanidicola]QGS52194.1 hypothetical protein STABA_v1c08390 [Spiroplasma tabanidicola]
MKKLLGFLGAITLITSTSSLAVACDNKPDRVSKVSLNPELAKQLIAALAGDPSLANKDFGDIFSSSDATTIVVRIINELIAKKFGYDSTNNNLEKLGLKKFDDENSEGYLPQQFIDTYKNQAGTVAEDLLFTEYTSSISSTRLDFSQINTKLYSLNPIEEVKSIVDLNGKSFNVIKGAKISFNKDGDKEWTILAEGDNKQQNLPELSDLTNPKSIFFIDGKYTSDNAKHQISPKTALRLRFQDYFDNELVKNIISNLLTMSYMDANNFSILPSSESQEDSTMSPFINTSSPLFSKTQSWFTTNTTGENRNWTTNVRMVWSIKFRKDNESKVRDELKKHDINSGSDKVVDFSNGNLKQGSSLIKLMSDIAKSLKTEEESGVIYNEDNSNAYDSFFRAQGYKGFTIFENGSAIGNNPISGKNYESAVKEAKKPSILLKSGSPFFEDNEDKNIEEIVFTLPIYMIELLGASAESNDSYIYQIKGADEKGKDIEFGWSGYGSSKTKYKDIWNQDNNKEYHSVDVQNLISGKDIEDSSQVSTQESNYNSAGYAMINQIKYMVSQDSTISELAKTVLYTKYLDADHIYYAGLYDQIGKYIKNNKDADD